MNCNNGDKRTSCSADINHLLYYYEKNNISDMMITGFPAPPVRRSLSVLFFFCFFFLVICLITYFSCYIFRAFDFSIAQFLTSLFLVLLYAYSYSLFAIIQLFSKLSSEKQQQYKNVYKDIKIYIFLCLPLQSESVYCCI